MTIELKNMRENFAFDMQRDEILGRWEVMVGRTQIGIDFVVTGPTKRDLEETRKKAAKVLKAELRRLRLPISKTVPMKIYAMNSLRIKFSSD